MSTLRVRLFGRFSVRRERQPVVGLDASKVQELLCYLLLYRDRPHPRESLAALLWGDTPTAQARKNLRQTLWQLQSALDPPDLPAGPRLLRVEPDWVHLNPEADLWLDVAAFEQGIALVQGAPGSHLDSSTALALRDAVQLYEADLLGGWYQDWCIFERERLQSAFLATLDKLMDYGEAHHQYESGLTYGQCILRYDQARERTHRQMMRLHYLAGDRSGALRQYERCVAALREELGVAPGRRTEALYQQIRADLLDPTPLPPAEATPEPPIPLTSELVNRLKRLHGTIAEMQQRVQQEILAVEHALEAQ